VTREPPDPEFLAFTRAHVDALFQQALEFERTDRATGADAGSLVRETLTVAREFGVFAYEMDVWTAELDRQMEGARTQLRNFRTWNEP